MTEETTEAIQTVEAPKPPANKWWLVAAINTARVLVGLTLIVSGFVKAVDPHGTQFKLEDYAEAVGLSGVFPDWLLLLAATMLSAVEFWMGLLLLLAIWRRVVSKCVLAFMAFMTAVTVWIYFANPVSDCGCFGDAIKLSNGETLLKNVVLLMLSALTAWRPTLMPRMIKKNMQLLILRYSVLFILGISAYCLYYLPILDFRPYHIGADIKAGMEIPKGAPQPEFETTFILEKNGERREFTLDNYPDSTWTFIDSKTKVLKKGYEPPIHDFSIQLEALAPRQAASLQQGDMREEQWRGAYVGDDITDIVLNDTSYVFLLISPHLEKADDSNFGNIDQLYEYAEKKGYAFLCLTASGEKGIRHWIDTTGAEYPFCHTDETTLKTMIRSNPGLMLLRRGVVVGKWSHNDIPSKITTYK